MTEAIVRAAVHIIKAAACIADLFALAFAAPILALLRRELPSLHLPGSGTSAATVDGANLKVIGKAVS